VSMASKYSRGFESAARWPKTTSSRWSCVGAGRESRGAGEVSARRTRAGRRRRRRRQKNVGEARLSMCGHKTRQDAEGRRTGRSSTVVSSVAPTRRRVLLWRSSPSAGTSAPRFADAPASAPRARATLVPETPVTFPNSSPHARAAAPRPPAARAPSRTPPRHPVPPIPLVTTPIAPPTPRRSAGR